jgi:hypothetical protein
MTPWIYKNEFDFEIPNGAFGFVYKIEYIGPVELLQKFGICKTKYIGRKYLTASKTVSKRVLKKDGTKTLKKKKSRVESQWRGYMGSCKPLLADIEKLGMENYRFEILAFAQTKGQVNMMEEFCQMRSGVLIDDSFYNDSIGARGFIGVKITNEFKETLRGIGL